MAHPSGVGFGRATWPSMSRGRASRSCFSVCSLRRSTSSASAATSTPARSGSAPPPRRWATLLDHGRGRRHARTPGRLASLYRADHGRVPGSGVDVGNSPGRPRNDTCSVAGERGRRHPLCRRTSYSQGRWDLPGLLGSRCAGTGPWRSGARVGWRTRGRHRTPKFTEGGTITLSARTVPGRTVATRSGCRSQTNGIGMTGRADG